MKNNQKQKKEKYVLPSHLKQKLLKLLPQAQKNQRVPISQNVVQINNNQNNVSSENTRTNNSKFVKEKKIFRKYGKKKRKSYLLSNDDDDVVEIPPPNPKQPTNNSITKKRKKKRISEEDIDVPLNIIPQKKKRKTSSFSLRNEKVFQVFSRRKINWVPHLKSVKKINLETNSPKNTMVFQFGEELEFSVDSIKQHEGKKICNVLSVIQVGDSQKNESIRNIEWMVCNSFDGSRQFLVVTTIPEIKKPIYYKKYTNNEFYGPILIYEFNDNFEVKLYQIINHSHGFAWNIHFYPCFDNNVVLGYLSVVFSDGKLCIYVISSDRKYQNCELVYDERVSSNLFEIKFKNKFNNDFIFSCVKWTYNMNYLACGCFDGSLHIFATNTTNDLKRISYVYTFPSDIDKGCLICLRDIAVTELNQNIISTISDDGAIRSYDLRNFINFHCGLLSGVFSGSSLVFPYNTSELVASLQDGSIRQYSPTNNSFLTILKPDDDAINKVSFGFEKLLYCTNNGKIVTIEKTKGSVGTFRKRGKKKTRNGEVQLECSLNSKNNLIVSLDCDRFDEPRIDDITRNGMNNYESKNKFYYNHPLYNAKFIPIERKKEFENVIATGGLSGTLIIADLSLLKDLKDD